MLERRGENGSCQDFGFCDGDDRRAIQPPLDDTVSNRFHRLVYLRDGDQAIGVDLLEPFEHPGNALGRVRGGEHERVDVV